MVPQGEYTYGDVVLYDNLKKEKIVVKADDLSSQLKKRYTPIAIVVIPSAHNVYETGEAGCMSLVFMSHETPSTGSLTPLKLYWGQNSAIIHGLSSFEDTAYRIGEILHEDSWYVGVPTDAISKGDICPDDNKTRYQNHDESLWETYDDIVYEYLTTSPYLSNDSRNPKYYDDTTCDNAHSSFLGKKYSQQIWDSDDRYYRNFKWNNDDPIENSPSDNGFPAVRSCIKFYTAGTSRKDWYLPSIGELGYLPSRLSVLNATINKINDTFYTNYPLLKTEILWSSTQKDKYTAYALWLDNFAVLSYNKGNNFSVRAFTRI